MARGRAAVLLTTAAFAIAAQAAPAAAPLQPGVWLTRAEVARLPMRGPAWGHLKDAADAPMGRARLADQNSGHDVHVLAAALLYARTGEERYRREVATGVVDAIGTERGGRTLALARGLVAYVVAADLIDLRRYDPGRDARFRTWLAAVRTERLTPSDNPTLVATHELRPNNWGTHAGASRIAADVYLGDTGDLARAAAVFKGWLGDRRTYHGFRFGALSWQADPKAPVGVDPPGATRDGQSIDGALPDDMRRGCGVRFPPCPTLYAWEAMQGAVVQAELLSRQGFDAWQWGHQALRRAGAFLFDLHRRYGAREWGAPEGHAWVPWLLNARYGTHFPTTESARPGKGMGFTDWTAATGCASPPCDGPRGPRRRVHPVAAAPQGTPSGPAAGLDWPMWAALGAGALAAGAALRRAYRGRQGAARR